MIKYRRESSTVPFFFFCYSIFLLLPLSKKRDQLEALIWSRKSPLSFLLAEPRECGGRKIPPIQIPILPLGRCRESEETATCIKSNGRSLFLVFPSSHLHLARGPLLCSRWNYPEPKGWFVFD